MRKLHIVAVVAAIVASVAAKAQNTALQTDYVVRPQSMAVLPEHPSGLSVVDGKLYCFADGLLVEAQRREGDIVAFLPDTTFAKIDPAADYVVRHPVNGDLYFTKPDKHGLTCLYVARREGKKGKLRVKRVKLDGMNVKHPTFTSDGKVMVFVSDEKRRNYGGYDLWYVLWEKDEWGRAVNMGGRVNTKGDETSPHMYGDFLIFASNGRQADPSEQNIYVTRLVSKNIVGDTASMVQIGRQTVQPLPAPVNIAGANDRELVVDTVARCCYWVSDRQDGCCLYACRDKLQGAMLWGRVFDKLENPLRGVSVTALKGDRKICTTKTDAQGFYTLNIHPERDYRILFERDGYFSTRTPLASTPVGSESLIYDIRNDVLLDSLPIGVVIEYRDLFGPGADIKMSPYGKEQLEPLVRFLHDNPAYSIQMTLRSDVTTDPAFNRLLTARRIKSLQDYLRQVLPYSVGVEIANACDGADGCMSGEGPSVLSVIVERGR